jgi:hypothetical protein
VIPSVFSAILYSPFLSCSLLQCGTCCVISALHEGLVREHRHAQSGYPLVRQPRLCEVRKGIRSSNSSLRFRLKSSPPPFLFRARTVERGFVAHILRLISRSLLRRSWHLPRGLTISLAGCRGFTGPVPPPLSMSAAGRPACLAGNYITSVRRMQCPPARICCGFRAAHLAATLSLPRREVSANREKTSQPCASIRFRIAAYSSRDDHRKASSSRYVAHPLVGECVHSDSPG